MTDKQQFQIFNGSIDFLPFSVFYSEDDTSVYQYIYKKHRIDIFSIFAKYHLKYIIFIPTKNKQQSNFKYQ